MMLTHNAKTFVIVAMVMGVSVFTGCNVNPTNPPSATGDTPVSDTLPSSVDSIYNKIFSRLIYTGDSLPDGLCDIQNTDEGTVCFYRIMHELQELPSDLQHWIWNDVGLADIMRHDWTSQNALLTGIYRRLLFNIELCNTYLDLTKNHNVGIIKTKRGEVLFMRAYYYSYVVDLFGRFPLLITSQYKQMPPQANRTELFNQVIKDLQDALLQLPAVGQKTSYYRIDQAAAWLLLARMYLNAKVYTGQDQWAEAAYYADLVINSTYSLCPTYRYLFMGDNSLNGAMQEFIMVIPQDGEKTKSWGGLYAIAPYYEGYKSEADLSGLTENWKCYRSQKRLVDLFFPNGTTVTGTATELTQAAGDARALLRNKTDDLTWSLPTNYTSALSYDFTACWGIQKWTNLSFSSQPSSDVRWPDTDIPLMRTAEAYLTYTEAQFRLNNISDALDAINKLRLRAGATPFQSLTLKDILDEWGREFYAEGRRRTDLIRFNMFGGNTNYVWEGKASDFDSYRNVYPIPAEILQEHPDYEQNLGY